MLKALKKLLKDDIMIKKITQGRRTVKRKIQTISMVLALSGYLLACGKEVEAPKPVEEAYRVDTGKMRYSDIDDAIYDVTEAERNNKYSGAEYVDSVISIGDTGKYIQVSVPKSMIEASVSSITDGKSVDAPIQNDSCNVTLHISASPYNYENGDTEKVLINRSYNRVADSSEYRIVRSLSGGDGSYKYMVDKVEYGTSLRQRIACKARHYGDAVVFITVSTGMESSDMEMIFGADRAYEILDSIDFKADFDFKEKAITAEMAQEINDANKLVVDESLFEGLVKINNPVLLHEAQVRLGTDDIAFTEEELAKIEEIEIYNESSSDEIYDLSELKYFTGVKHLTVTYSCFRRDIEYFDTDSLSALTNLEGLWLEIRNNFESESAIEKEFKLDWISSLTNLKVLEIRMNNDNEHDQNYIYDITPLANLQSLENLFIMSYKDGKTRAGVDRKNGTIKSIEPLKNLTHLKTLTIQYDGSDISAMGGLHDLEELKMSCMATDISALYGLENLRYVEFMGDEYDVSSVLEDNVGGEFRGNMVCHVD